MPRIVILGSAGTGKTTLARKLGERAHVPVLVLDDLWPQDLTKDDVPEFRKLIEELHQGEDWISDGNYAAASFDLRLPRATLIVWAERPRWLCLYRALKRVLKKGERHRPQDLLKVLKFIWNFERVNRPRIEKLRLEIAPAIPVRRLKTDKEAAAFLQEF